MNPISLYITTSRLVFQSDLSSELEDLNRLLPYLRKSLSCVVCCKLLVEPQSPSTTGCQHHVCRVCVGKRKKLKPVCRFCKDFFQYRENMQLRILLQCYKSICLYIRTKPIYAEIQKCSTIQSLSKGSVPGGSRGVPPNSLMDLIEEGAGFVDVFQCNSGLSRSAYSILPCIFPVPVVSGSYERPDNCKSSQKLKLKLKESEQQVVYSQLHGSQEKLRQPQHLQLQPALQKPQKLQKLQQSNQKVNVQQQRQKQLQHQRPLLHQNLQRQKLQHEQRRQLYRQQQQCILIQKRKRQQKMGLQQQPYHTQTNQQIQQLQQPQKPQHQNQQQRQQLLQHQQQEQHKLQLHQQQQQQQVLLQRQLNQQIVQLPPQLSPQQQQKQAPIFQQPAQAMPSVFPPSQQQPRSAGSDDTSVNTQSSVCRVVPSRFGPAIIHTNSPSSRINFVAPSIVSSNSLQSSVVTPVVKNTCAPTTPRIVNITTPQEIKYQQTPIKTVSSGSTMYSVLYAGNGNKFTIKRKPDAPSILKTVDAQPMKMVATMVSVATTSQQPLMSSSHTQLAQMKPCLSAIRPNGPQRQSQATATQLPQQVQQQQLPQQHFIQQPSAQQTIVYKHELQRQNPPQLSQQIQQTGRQQQLILQQPQRQQQYQQLPKTQQFHVQQSQLLVHKPQHQQQSQQPQVLQLQQLNTQQSQPLKLQQPMQLQQQPLVEQQEGVQPPQQHLPPRQQFQQQQQQLKRKGCRCGNATPTPGKLTCCGQRCPCYVDSKSCIDCKCRGCRNPHRADGLKIRRSLSELLQQYNTTHVQGQGSVEVRKESTQQQDMQAGVSMTGVPGDIGESAVVVPNITSVTYCLNAVKVSTEPITTVASRSFGGSKVKIISAGHQAAAPAMVSAMKPRSATPVTTTTSLLKQDLSKPSIAGVVPSVHCMPSSNESGFSIRPVLGSFVTETSSSLNYHPVTINSVSSTASTDTTGGQSSSSIMTPLVGINSTNTIVPVSAVSSPTSNNYFGRLWTRFGDTSDTCALLNPAITRVGGNGSGPSTSRQHIVSQIIRKPDTLLSQNSVRAGAIPITSSAAASLSPLPPSSSLSPSMPVVNAPITSPSSSMMFGGGINPITTDFFIINHSPDPLSSYDVNCITNLDHLLDSDGDLCEDLEIPASSLVSID
ncbi:uncharacterized protein LOC128277869 [Anopheles cruzii]|uniref:uncharacterized protein LOC128277869 n=1 Tax=Anopheles cruzii TaxID=68878 RepID=UPI0022EC5F80|nr:uncharacterized protein LOC128277869 [Anopheles cruzii]